MIMFNEVKSIGLTTQIIEQPIGKPMTYIYPQPIGKPVSTTSLEIPIGRPALP